MVNGNQNADEIGYVFYYVFPDIYSQYGMERFLTFFFGE